MLISLNTRAWVLLNDEGAKILNEREILLQRAAIAEGDQYTPVEWSTGNEYQDSLGSIMCIFGKYFLPGFFGFDMRIRIDDEDNKRCGGG